MSGRSSGSVEAGRTRSILSSEASRESVAPAAALLGLFPECFHSGPASSRQVFWPAVSLSVMSIVPAPSTALTTTQPHPDGETLPPFPSGSRSSGPRVLLTGSDVLVRAEHVSKKFCRNLKKSLWYGLQDVGAELNPFRRRSGTPLSPAVTDLAGGAGSPGDGPAPGLPSVTEPLPDAVLLRPGEFWANDDISFELRRGECLGLIGHNGAGKTTLLKMLNGLIKPDRGRITMRGRVGALIALGAGFNPILTGRENIYVNGAVLGMNKSEIDAKMDEIIDFAGIRDFIDAPVQSYSSGMAVRLGFAIAVKTQPDVLLLDEVLAVGDVGFQAKCFNAIAEFRKKGTAFILVSHNMHMIARYSDRVLYLKKGRVDFSGDHEDGIQRFVSDMHGTPVSAPGPVVDWSVVHGTGRLVFTGARFLDADGRPTPSIRSGASFTMEIDYERKAPLERPPVLDLIMRDRQEILYQQTNVQAGHAFGDTPPSGTFAIHFERLPVNVPYVEFYFSALDPGTGEIFDWKRHVKLGVEQVTGGLGRLRVATEWSCVARSEEAAVRKVS